MKLMIGAKRTWQPFARVLLGGAPSSGLLRAALGKNRHWTILRKLQDAGVGGGSLIVGVSWKTDGTCLLETLENELLDTLKFDYDKVNSILTDKKPSAVWESYYNGEDQVITEKDYSRLGRRLFNAIKTRYSENRSFRSLTNKYLKSFEEIINNYQKTNDENKISLLLDSESGILFILISHSIGKLD